MRRVIFTALFLSSGFLAGCMSGPETYSVGKSAAVAGATGGLVGAGSGAIAGAVIANGDIGASILLGTAIGVPAGIALGAIYAATENQRVLAEYDSIIKSNKEEILRRQTQIDQLRESLRDESMMFEPNTDLRDRIYDGPTLGNYYR